MRKIEKGSLERYFCGFMENKNNIQYEICQIIGRRIAEIVHVLDIPKTDFAKKIGYDIGSMSQVYAGKRMLPAEKFVTIAEMFKVNMNYIFRGDGPVLETPQASINVNYSGNKDTQITQQDETVLSELCNQLRVKDEQIAMLLNLLANK